MYAESLPQPPLKMTDQTTQHEGGTSLSPSLSVVPTDPDALPEPGAKWELKKLSQKHKDICSLIAQGIGRGQIATLCGITPEYVTMLTKQPLCVAYIKDMSEFAGVQLEAMFGKTVEVIGQTLATGAPKEQMAAARLQLEVTKRIGRPDVSANNGAMGADERLLALSERLVGLLGSAKQQSDQIIEDVEFVEIPRDAAVDPNGSSDDE